jgi:hypothetical protein
MSKQGQTILTATELGLLPISDEIQHLKGNTATKLTRPTGCTSLVVHAEVGVWRFKLGDHEGSFSYATPSATVDDGTGSCKLDEDEKQAFQAPAEITFVGQDASAILTYYWI